MHTTVAKKHSHHKQFHGSPEFLASPQRLALLEIPRVVEICLEDVAVRDVLDVGTGSGVFVQAFAWLSTSFSEQPGPEYK